MMRQFSKFVNFKAHTGLPKAQTNSSQRFQASAEAGELANRLAVSIVKRLEAEQQIQTADLSWTSGSNETQPAAQPSKPASWFAAATPNKQAPPITDEETIAGRISFQGLTAVSETADRLDALLGTGPELPCQQRLASVAKPEQEPEDQPKCLNDIFWDLKLSNESIHNW